MCYPVAEEGDVKCIADVAVFPLQNAKRTVVGLQFSISYDPYSFSFKAKSRASSKLVSRPSFSLMNFCASSFLAKAHFGIDVMTPGFFPPTTHVAVRASTSSLVVGSATLRDFTFLFRYFFISSTAQFRLQTPSLVPSA